MRATRGDDVYRECQTTISLEERVAKLTGKEAGAFGQSGTMTNREFPISDRFEMLER
jgi:threonine aldolase